MLLHSKRRGASVLITVLAVALVVALLPYASGLLAGPVLYILWRTAPALFCTIAVSLSAVSGPLNVSFT